MDSLPRPMMSLNAALAIIHAEQRAAERIVRYCPIVNEPITLDDLVAGIEYARETAKKDRLS